MPQTVWTRTQPASIGIVQGAYQTFCAPATAETTYSLEPFNKILASSEEVALAAQLAWVKFNELVASWRHERGARSSISAAAMCPSYQAIIGMGETAVAFILMSLRIEGDEADQWFWALRAIAGEDPVRDEDRGDFPIERVSL